MVGPDDDVGGVRPAGLAGAADADADDFDAAGIAREAAASPSTEAALQLGNAFDSMQASEPDERGSSPALAPIPSPYALKRAAALANAAASKSKRAPAPAPAAEPASEAEAAPETEQVATTAPVTIKAPVSPDASPPKIAPTPKDALPPSPDSHESLPDPVGEAPELSLEPEPEAEAEPEPERESEPEPEPEDDSRRPSFEAALATELPQSPTALRGSPSPAFPAVVRASPRVLPANSPLPAQPPPPTPPVPPIPEDAPLDSSPSPALRDTAASTPALRDTAASTPASTAAKHARISSGGGTRFEISPGILAKPGTDAVFESPSPNDRAADDSSPATRSSNTNSSNSLRSDIAHNRYNIRRTTSSNARAPPPGVVHWQGSPDWSPQKDPSPSTDAKSTPSPTDQQALAKAKRSPAGAPSSKTGPPPGVVQWQGSPEWKSSPEYDSLDSPYVTGSGSGSGSGSGGSGDSLGATAPPSQSPSPPGQQQPNKKPSPPHALNRKRSTSSISPPNQPEKASPLRNELKPDDITPLIADPDISPVLLDGQRAQAVANAKHREEEREELSGTDSERDSQRGDGDEDNDEEEHERDSDRDSNRSRDEETDDGNRSDDSSGLEGTPSVLGASTFGARTPHSGPVSFDGTDNSSPDAGSQQDSPPKDNDVRSFDEEIHTEGADQHKPDSPTFSDSTGDSSDYNDSNAVQTHSTTPGRRGVQSDLLISPLALPSVNGPNSGLQLPAISPAIFALATPLIRRTDYPTIIESPVLEGRARGFSLPSAEMKPTNISIGNSKGKGKGRRRGATMDQLEGSASVQLGAVYVQTPYVGAARHRGRHVYADQSFTPDSAADTSTPPSGGLGTGSSSLGPQQRKSRRRRGRQPGSASVSGSGSGGNRDARAREHEDEDDDVPSLSDVMTGDASSEGSDRSASGSDSEGSEEERDVPDRDEEQADDDDGEHSDNNDADGEHQQHAAADDEQAARARDSARRMYHSNLQRLAVGDSEKRGVISLDSTGDGSFKRGSGIPPIMTVAGAAPTCCQDDHLKRPDTHVPVAFKRISSARNLVTPLNLASFCLMEALGTALFSLLVEKARIEAAFSEHGPATFDTTIALALGCAVGLLVLIGGLAPKTSFHPALTLILVLTGNMQWYLLPAAIIAQLFGNYFGTMMALLSSWDVVTQVSGEANGDMLRVAVIITGNTARSVRFLVLPEFWADFILALGAFMLWRYHGGAVIKATFISFLAIGISVAFISDGWAISPTRDIASRLACLTVVGQRDQCFNWAATLNGVFTPFLGFLSGAAIFIFFLLQMPYVAPIDNERSRA